MDIKVDVCLIWLLILIGHMLYLSGVHVGVASCMDKQNKIKTFV